MSMIKPDLKTWAESIAFIAREGVSASDKIVKAIEDELRTIARKYEQIGDQTGWWKEQENDYANGQSACMKRSQFANSEQEA